MNFVVLLYCGNILQDFPAAIFAGAFCFSTPQADTYGRQLLPMPCIAAGLSVSTWFAAHYPTWKDFDVKEILTKIAESSRARWVHA